MKLTQKIGKTS